MHLSFFTVNSYILVVLNRTGRVGNLAHLLAVIILKATHTAQTLLMTEHGSENYLLYSTLVASL